MMSAFKPLMLAHHADEQHPSHLAARQMAENVARRTGGRLEISIVQNCMVGDIPEQIRHVQSGEIDMALPPHDRMVDLIPKLACVALPFAFRDKAHAHMVLDGPFSRWISPDVTRSGLVFLGNWEWGFRQITNNVRPILKPEDVQGLRIRVPPVLAYQKAMIALGATPVIIEFSKLVQSMREGWADGQENPIAIIHAHGLQAYQRYLSIINYSYSAMVLIMNRQSYLGLDHEQQQILQEESRNAALLVRRLMWEEEKRQLVALAGSGMQIATPDLAPFRETANALWEALIQEGQGKDIHAFRTMLS